MIEYKGKKHEILISMIRLFRLEKQFKQPLFKVLESIEQSESIEKSYFLVHSSIDTEDSFEEFCNNYKALNLSTDLIEIFKVVYPMFTTDKAEENTTKKK